MGLMTAVTLSRVQQPLLMLVMVLPVDGHLLLAGLPAAGVGLQLLLLLLLLSQPVTGLLRKGRVMSMRQLMTAVVRKQIQSRVELLLLLLQQQGQLLGLSVS
jgi:hypothetical protein